MTPGSTLPGLTRNPVSPRGLGRPQGGHEFEVFRIALRADSRAAIGVLQAVDRVDADLQNEVGGVAALNAEQEPADGDRAPGELLTRERLAANGRLARVAAGGADIAVGFAASDRRVLAPRLMPTSSGYEQISDEASMNTGRSA
jgi:hypothetical protein